MTICDRCRKESSKPSDVLEVNLEFVFNGEIAPIVPLLELCRSCRKEMAAVVTKFIQEGRAKK